MTWSSPGVDVITPNPSTSGSARWNILAGVRRRAEGGQDARRRRSPTCKTLLTKNVSVQDSSASAALQTFTGGKGDVLLDYESDAIAAEKAGDAVQYIIPKQTILIQTPIAVTAKSSHAAQAQAFVNWLWTPAGADDLGAAGLPPGARVGRRSSSPASSRRRRSCSRSTTSAAGRRSRRRSSPRRTGSITKIEQAAGVPTASS